MEGKPETKHRREASCVAACNKYRPVLPSLQENLGDWQRCGDRENGPNFGVQCFDGVAPHILRPMLMFRYFPCSKNRNKRSVQTSRHIENECLSVFSMTRKTQKPN